MTWLVSMLRSPPPASTTSATSWKGSSKRWSAAARSAGASSAAASRPRWMVRSSSSCSPPRASPMPVRAPGTRCMSELSPLSANAAQAAWPSGTSVGSGDGSGEGEAGSDASAASGAASEGTGDPHAARARTAASVAVIARRLMRFPFRWTMQLRDQSALAAVHVSAPHAPPARKPVGLPVQTRRRARGLARGGIGEALEKRVVRGLLLELLGHDRRVALGEDAGHPGALVVEAPDREARAGGDVEARLEHLVVPLRLESDLCGVRLPVLAERHADVGLGDGHLQPEGREPLEVRLDGVVEAVHEAQVTLGADGVPLHAVGEQLLGQRVVA